MAIIQYVDTPLLAYAISHSSAYYPLLVISCPLLPSPLPPPAVLSVSAADDANPENTHTRVSTPATVDTPNTAASVGGGGGLGGHREAARRAWEAEKKLRRRVEALERRLDERGVELQAAEGQAAKAKDLLARWVGLGWLGCEGSVVRVSVVGRGE